MRLATHGTTLAVAVAAMTTLAGTALAQKLWDGQATDGLWGTASNWSPDGVPTASDDVLLDDSIVAGGYVVTIDVAATARTVQIGTPANTSTIALWVVSTSTLPLALSIAGDGGPGDDFIVEKSGYWSNYSTAASGPVVGPFSSSGQTGRVKQGGFFQYGTVIDFDASCPADAVFFDEGSTVEFWSDASATALPGRTFGNLAFYTLSPTTFTLTGSEPLVVRDAFTIGSGVTLNSTLTGGFEANQGINNDGNGGSLGNTLAGSPGVRFSGNGSVIGVGTPLTFPDGFSIDAGVVLGVVGSQILSVGSGDSARIDGQATGTGVVTIGAGATFRTAHVDGFDGAIQTSGVNSFSSSANYVFDGTAYQVTGVSFPSTVASAEVDNPMNVQLSGNLTATTIVLTNGEFATGPDLTTTNVVQTGGFVSGKLIRTVDATVTGPIHFPVGTTGDYTPVTIDITSAGTGTGTMSVMPAVGYPSGIVDSAATLFRFWQIESAGVAGTTCTLSFTYLESDIHTADESTFVAGRYNGSGTDWTTFPGTRDTVLNTVTATGVTAFSPWTLGTAASLPVEIDTYLVE